MNAPEKVYVLMFEPNKKIKSRAALVLSLKRASRAPTLEEGHTQRCGFTVCTPINYFLLLLPLLQQVEGECLREKSRRRRERHYHFLAFTPAVPIYLLLLSFLCLKRKSEMDKREYKQQKRKKGYCNGRLFALIASYVE